MAQPSDQPYAPMVGDSTTSRQLFGLGHEAWLAADGRSGLTAVTPIGPILPSPKTFYNNEKRRAYQRYTLEFPFHTQMLIESESYTLNNDAFSASDLTGVLHPCLSRDRWARTPESLIAPFYPLPDINDGYWYAHNDRVWAILYPSLLLVTKMLHNADLLDW